MFSKVDDDAASRQTFKQRFKEAAGPLRAQFRRSPAWAKVVAFICLVYLLMPIDPWDVLLPWLAWQDDLFIAAILLKLLHKYGSHPDEELMKPADLIRKLFTNENK